ncbi:MAG TPA: glycosyltransferase [Streptosporangiaceae bacterium]|nr:glycosyltransferase [Streptosporangiaceae bacterium]
MTAKLKVVHVTARTPYARKLQSPAIMILNSADIDPVGRVPRDVTLGWLLERRPFSWFDVLHLHHIEFDSVTELRTVLRECARSRRRVVFTAHDIDPVFGDRPSYHRKLRLLAEQDVPFVCLTPGSAAVLRHRLGAALTSTVIPHGYVVSPDALPVPRPRPAGAGLRYLLFGALRANRDIPTVLYNWRLGRRQRSSTLSLLLRAPGRANLAHERDRWELIAATAASEPRLHVDVVPYASDADVANFAAECDALILPYLWGSHSGQLELAFDLGLLPVASSVGYLREQVAAHGGLAEEPVWFDWSDGSEWAYGERFLAALDVAAERQCSPRSPRSAAEFAGHRRKEHAEIMAAYSTIYEES